jgi:alanyl-tRNA synthetase
LQSKLYYRDPYIKTFTTKIRHQNQDEAGNWYVVLEETAFYPTGGGQPHDTGTLDDIQVVNVEEMNGEIRHYIEKPLPEKSVNVTGVIDWERRFDHMQQHSGQHILSAAFEELFGYQTVSFHLGNEIVTIDLDIEELSEQEAMAAEKLANQMILENRPIETKWVAENELSKYPLRKMPSVTENIRLVIIPNFDYNGCGGTHPNSTGQVFAIKILDWERQRKRIRVQFVCGNRVLKQLGQKHRVIRKLNALLNAPEEELITAATRLLDHGKEMEKSLEEAREKLLHYEVKELLESRNPESQLIAKVFQNRSIQELQKLARMLTAEKEEVTVLFVAEIGDRLQFVFARGSAGNSNMKQIAADVLPIINGKGGGNETFAQGGGDAHISGDELLNKLIEKLNM